MEGMRWGQARLPNGADRSQVMEEAGGTSDRAKTSVRASLGHANMDGGAGC